MAKRRNTSILPRTCSAALQNAVKGPLGGAILIVLMPKVMLMHPTVPQLELNSPLIQR